MRWLKLSLVHTQDITQVIHLHLRVYFNKDNRQLIRAAAVGKQGPDKRIDILSMAMMNQLTVDELAEFEVAYAPPYSHPKDLINMIGYKARNI